MYKYETCAALFDIWSCELYSYHSVHFAVPWFRQLGFGGILRFWRYSVWNIFLPNILWTFGIYFFTIKQSIGHISGMVGPIDVKRKEDAWVGCLIINDCLMQFTCHLWHWQHLCSLGTPFLNREFRLAKTSDLAKWQTAIKDCQILFVALQGQWIYSYHQDPVSI